MQFLGKNTIKEKICDWLMIGMRSCIHCESFLVRKSLLCYFCESKLFSLSCSEGLYHHFEHQVSCFSLLSWERDQNIILNRLIPNLKGKRQRKAWSYFAKLIAYELSRQSPRTLGFSLNEELLIVPCPSRKKVNDHAFFLAQGLSEELKVPLVKTMEFGKFNSESKKMKRADRLAIQKLTLSKVESEKPLIHNKADITVLFVDDVITTGATLKAANLLHKEYKNFIAISLAFRR